MMSTLRLSLLGIFGICGGIVSSLAILALPAAAQVLPATAPLVAPAAAGETTRYSDDLMRVDFPTDWKIDISDEGLMIANVTTEEAQLVATQIARIAASPGAVVNANIDSFIDEGAVVGRYRAVTIDGQDALVMWLSERPGVLSDAIATFIGYGNETVLLFSRYSPDNATAEDSILQMHLSFANLSSENSTLEDSTVENDLAE